MNRRRKILLFYLINEQDIRNSGNHPETNFTDRIVGARIALKKRRKHSPVVKGGGGGGDRSEGTGILVDGAKHPFVLVKSSVQKSNEDESAPEKYSLTSKARRTKDTLFISLPFIASIPSRFTPSPLPNRFHDFPPLRDKVVPRFRHSRIIENAHVNTVKTKIIFASSSFSLKNRDREREREEENGETMERAVY